jgi:flagella basal body P-ring formation protein FlgA
MRAVPALALFLTILSLFLPPTAVEAQAVSVYLERSVELGEGMVALGDIATVVAADSGEAEALRKLPLWPGSGRAGLVPAGLIQRKLTAVTGGQVVVVGAQTLVLPAGVGDGGERQFYKKLLEAVAGLPGGVVGRVEVELLSPPELRGEAGSAQLSEPVLDLSLQPARAGTPRGYPAAPPAGLYQVLYRIASGGASPAQERGLAVELRQLLPVAVAARDLPAGSVLRWKDLALEEQDIGATAGDYLSFDGRPEAFRTVGPISRGERIDPARLERHYLVRAGDRITVVFVRPGLRVSLPGRAISSGAVGDIVQVRPQEGGRRFAGQVSGSGEVTVEEL